MLQLVSRKNGTVLRHRHQSKAMSTNDSNDGKSDGCIDHSDPEVLERLYHSEGLTLGEIGELAGVSGGAVAHHMRKHDIKRRGKGETNRVEKVTFYTRKDGYEVWGGNDCTMPVHRLLAVSEYGFDAVSGSDVHHKIPIEWLNTPDNVEPISRVDHVREHSMLDESDVKEIRRLKHDDGLLDREIAEKFDISRTYVSNIVQEYVWTDVE